MRILAVGAHPDDIEGLCGGTLAKRAAMGDHITIAVATNGEVGSQTLPKAEIAEVRRLESAAAAAVIGADFIWMNYPDEFLFSNRESRLDFLNTVRRARPDVILTHSPEDYHPDHRTTSQILWDIRVMTTVPNIETDASPCETIPEIYYIDTLAGIDFTPEFFVDITEFHDTKMKMLACHESQISFGKSQYELNAMEHVERLAQYRGLQCGALLAEGFKASPTWPRRPGAPLLMDGVR